MVPFSFSQALKFCAGHILAGHIFAFLYVFYFVVEQLKAYYLWHCRRHKWFRSPGNSTIRSQQLSNSQYFLWMSPWKVKERLQEMGPFQPMTIFLRQEIDRMQRVLSLVRSTLTELKLALDGTIIMSENLRDALDCMFDARIPARWKKVSTVLLLLCEWL